MYFASIGSILLGSKTNNLRIWFLSESYGQTEWLLKYCADLSLALHENIGSFPPKKENLGSWVLQDVNYNYQYGHLEPEMDDEAQDYDYGCFTYLGFHPFEEVVFLSRSLRWGLAYDLTSSKLHYMGYMYPKEYDSFTQCEGISEAYPYTPCWM